MADTALVPYDASRSGGVLVQEGERRASSLVKRAKGSVRVRNNEENGLEARQRALMIQRQLEADITVSEVYLKIGTHWSPIDGNAASQYGLGWIE